MGAYVHSVTDLLVEVRLEHKPKHTAGKVFRYTKPPSPWRISRCLSEEVRPVEDFERTVAFFALHRSRARLSRRPSARWMRNRAHVL